MLHFLNQYYYPISVIIIIAFCFIMGIYYSRKLSSRELVLIAILSALAAISRIAFYWIPQFKPQAAMVFVCASIFGSVPGMIVGLLSGFLANFVMGQGPWTPFQMLGFGLVGIIGGFTDTDKTYIAAIVGFISTFVLYGAVVNFASMIMMTNRISLEGFIAMEISGIPFDLIHASATFIFILIIWKAMRRKLKRLRDKYKMLQR